MLCRDNKLKEEEMSSSNLLGDGAVANKAASILNKTVSMMRKYLCSLRAVSECTVLFWIGLDLIGFDLIALDSILFYTILLHFEVDSIKRCFIM